MEIIESVDYKTIKEIITNPKLFSLTYGQSLKIEDYEVEQEYKYLLLKKENAIVGCCQTRDFTKITLENHIFILPQYWGTGLSKEVVKDGHDWARSKGYKTVTTSVPATCSHVLKFMTDVHYMPCGLIKNGIIYNNYLVSLILFEFDLTKEISE